MNEIYHNPWVIGIGVTVIGGLILYYVFGIGDKKIYVPKTLFSDTQIIRDLPRSMGGSKTLNLDNVATLTPIGSSSTEHIEMTLNVTPMVWEPGPDFKDGDMEVRGGFENGKPIWADMELVYFDPKINPTYTFNTTNQRSHEIESGNRKFVVTLQEIKKLNVPNIAIAREYTFAISERTK